MGILDSLFGSNKAKTESQYWNEQTGYSVNNLPDWQTAYIRPAVDRVAGLATPQYYAGALTAGRSPMSTAADSMAYNRAMAGSPVLSGAQNYAQNVLSGAYLNANPYVNAMYDNAAARVTQNYSEATLPGIASMFSAAGRYGPGAMGKQVERAQQTLGDTLNRLATDVYGQNYARERTAMDAASGQAAGLAAADYYAPEVLSRMGAAANAYDQAAIDREMQRYQFEQLAPWQAEQMRLGMLAGDYGGRSTTTSTEAQGNARQIGAQPSNGILGNLFGAASSGFGNLFGGQLGGRLANKIDLG